MPQMSPYNWFFYNILFNLTLIYSISNLHYFIDFKIKQKFINIKIKSFNLKW